MSDSAPLVWHSIAEDPSTPEDSIVRGEAALQLAFALEQLPEDQRIAVELRYLGHRPLKDIAQYMSKTAGSVAGLICRGVENLRNHLPPDLREVLK